MNISAQREYLATLRYRYHSLTSRREKSAIIAEVTANLSIARKSAIRTLNRTPKRYKSKRPGRKERYGFDLAIPLKLLWETAGHPCSKRLQPQIGDLLDQMKKFGEIQLYDMQEPLLRQMKCSTIDKLLEAERDISQKEYGLSGTKRSPLLKTLIPIRTTFNQEETKTPGHIEMDCVLHCGESLSGMYAETLNLLDIATHWNEKCIFLKKTKGRVVGGVHILRKQFPFPILSVDFDNGFEFVNWILYGYCKREKILFTRSRSYHKNDQAHIEGKNYQSIRRVVGYDRINEPEIVELINDLYQNEHRLLTNFFYTTLKLKEKTRVNGRVRKVYEKAQTPYQRIVTSHDIDQSVKAKLRSEYQTLNPVSLQRSLQTKLQNVRRLLDEKQNNVR